MVASCQNLDVASYEATRKAVAAEPTNGQGSFTSVTEWVDGARARTTARSFAIETDEPAPLGGTDQGIDPMELLLAAVGSCLQIGWVTQAAKRGIDLRGLRIEVSGDYDLRGYFDLDDEVRPGFSEVSYSVAVDSDADEQTLEEIRATVEATSPMLDNARNGALIVGRVQIPVT